MHIETHVQTYQFIYMLSSYRFTDNLNYRPFLQHKTSGAGTAHPSGAHEFIPGF